MRLNGGEAVIESLRRANAQVAFGIVGSSLLEVFDLLPTAGIKYIGARHEQWAAHMADAYVRVRRAPAVCLVQNGPGVTNLVTGFVTAQAAGSPIVGVAGAVASDQTGRGTYQEVDQLRVMEPACKWVGRANRPDRIPEIIQQAFREAWSPPTGPTFVDIPRDFLYEIISAHRRGPDVLLGPSVVGTDDNTVNDVGELLIRSERPVILAGRGVVWARASEAVIGLAEAVSAPIVTSYGHNDAVPNGHPLYMGSLGRGGSQAAMRITAETDLLLALGTRLDSFGFVPYYGFEYFPSSAAIVQVDVDASQIGRFYPANVGVVCDVLSFVDALSKIAANRRQSRSRWMERGQQLKQEWKLDLAKSITPEARPVQLEAAYAVLDEFVDDQTIVAIDVGSTPSYSYARLNYARPGTFLSPLRAGGVGFALPAAIGAKVAEPDSKVIAILGDGAFTMELSNLITATEYELPIIGLVFDNAAWGAEKANQQYYCESRYVGSLLKNPELVSVAEALGARAYLASSTGELQRALRSAIDEARSMRSSIIVVPVDPDRYPLPARRDVLRKPERGLYS